jgi:hypothetical protein
MNKPDRLLATHVLSLTRAFIAYVEALEKNLTIERREAAYALGRSIEMTQEAERYRWMLSQAARDVYQDPLARRCYLADLTEKYHRAHTNPTPEESSEKPSE